MTTAAVRGIRALTARTRAIADKVIADAVHELELRANETLRHWHDTATERFAGFLRALSGDASQYLDGDGEWSSPIAKIAGATGDAGPHETNQILLANAPSNSTTTFAPVMTTKRVAPGWYTFRYFVVTQSGAITTGQKFRVRHSGTVGEYAVIMRWPSTGAAATTSVWQAGNVTTASLMLQFFQQFTHPNDLGPMTDVNAANTDMLCVIEGFLQVTAEGDLHLDHASEVAAASTVQAGTHLELRKVA
jgi:hypothetical protein